MAAHAAAAPGAGTVPLLSLAAPWWLLGLLLLPVIRWLHRGGRHRRSVPVARLGLWRGAVVSPPAEGERRPPDPAWRRRALLAALLCTALAEPQLPPRHPGLTLWVDDSISMQTRQTQGTRLAMALAQARELLKEASPGDVEVRALGDPWQRLGPLTDAVVTTLLAGAGRKEPGAPPAALLRPDRLHWLITDGADVGLLDWPAGRRADRVIQVAAVTRNVGVERLSARRNPNEPDKLDLLAKLTNGGSLAETRVVVFATAAGEVARSSQRLDSGTSVLVVASVPASAQVVASLQPGDALVEDDQMMLDLAPLRRRRVAVDPACPPALVAAVSSHPALVVAPPGAPDADVALDCATRAAAGAVAGGAAGGVAGTVAGGAAGGAADVVAGARAGPAPGAVATIGIRADRTPAQAAGPVQWSSLVAEGNRLPLDTARLQVVARLQARPGDRVLLALGGEPVIVSRAGALRSIETSLDFASTGLANGPEIPLLVNLLFERVLESRLLDAVAVNDRGPAASRVVPVQSVAAQSAARTMGPSGSAASWARPLLLLALLVLLWEIAALVRQWAHLRPGAVTGMRPGAGTGMRPGAGAGTGTD